MHIYFHNIYKQNQFVDKEVYNQCFQIIISTTKQDN